MAITQQITPEQMVKIQNHFREHPEWFFKHWLDIELYEKQIEICNSIVHNRVTTVASCNSAGKTGTAGGIVPWYLLSHRNSIVVTTAPKWQQVKDLLWREINTKWERAARVLPLSPQRPNVVSWDIAPNWFAVGVASKDPNKIQGYHADSGHLLVIIDEAAAIEEPMFEGVWALMTANDCRLLMIGNPTSQTGTFRESHKPSYPSSKIRIDMFETPNFVENNIANEADLIAAIESGRDLLQPYPMLASPQWAYERLKAWGQESPMYQARCRARFPEVGENNLIPLNWIEQATTNERLDSILGLNLVYGDDKQEAKNMIVRQEALDKYLSEQDMSRGVDLARFGSDSTVVNERKGKIHFPQTIWHKMDTMSSAGRVWPMIKNMPTDLTGLDVIGVGAGVVDRLHELQREMAAKGQPVLAQIFGVNVADAPTELPEGLPTMQFANKRAELYWKLRGLFESGDIYLMPNADGKPPEDLMYELSAIQYDYKGDKIYIEEKKDMKKRLLRSPDRADAMVLSYGVKRITIFEENKSTPVDDDDWEPPTLAEEAESSDEYAAMNNSWDNDY